MLESRSNSVQTGLAGAVALAAGSAAYGTIIIVAPPANLPNAASPATAGPLTWDVNGDGTSDFNFTFRNPQSATAVHWQANMNTLPGSGVVGYLGPFVSYGTNLSAGQVIGPGSNILTTAQIALGSVYGAGAGLFYGGFAEGTPNTGGTGPGAAHGFVGFRFQIGGLDRYGWLEVEVMPATGAAGSGGLAFFGAAYEDSGAPIGAGAVPAPGAVGVLALGAAALLRRKRGEAA